MVFFALQLLERDLNDIQKSSINLFIHVCINTKTGIFPVQFSKCAEQPVPDAQNVAIIAIGIRQLVMMVHMVQVGSDDYQNNNLIGSVWQPELGVGDDVRERLKYLPDNQHADHRPQYGDPKDQETSANEGFSRVLPGSSRNIYFQIAVMHQVELP